MQFHFMQSVRFCAAALSVSAALAQTPSKTVTPAATPQQQVTVANTTAQPVPVQVVNPVQSPSGVTINNGPSQPIPTTDPTNQAKSPIFGQILNLTLTGINGQTSFVQSTGKRAMIRHMSIRCRLPSPEEVVVTVTGKFGFGPMVIALQSSFLKVDRAIAIASMPVDLMIDAGSETIFEFERSTPNINGPGTAICEIFLVGYTVPQPA